MTGAEYIVAERLRQIRHPSEGGEGFSHAHDDALTEGALTAAADCYMLPTMPGDQRRNLVIAGALYLAEAEKYDRAGKPDQGDRCRATAARIGATIDATPYG